jgi:hypothetical protein
VKIDSNNGCFLTLSTKVKVNTISVSAMKDTTLCSGGTVTLTASGGATYEWINGPNTATYQFTADTSASYIVHGYDSVGCTDSAMVEVVVLPSPTVDLPEDTGACFRDSLYLIASGAENYEWKNGPNKAVYPLRVLTSGWYFLRSYNSYGCEVKDSIYVERHLIHFGQVFSDT